MLARWILDERLPVRLQLQAHKYIWSPDDAGRVMEQRAVVLLSGGLDSTTAAALARRDGMRALRADRPLRPGARVRRSPPRAASPARSASSSTSSSTSISRAFGGSSLLGEGEIPKDPIESRNPIRNP